MKIGGKDYEIGQHIRIISAKSILHYKYGIKDDEATEMTGMTGVIVSESTYNEDSVADLKVDKEYSDAYRNGMTRLFKDDEIELLEGDRVAEQRQFVRDKVSRHIRCSDCQYLHENGNCLKVGGFYSSIDNKYCPMEAGGEDE